jgi:1-acyl-sn-glycerol-3-phosphate acyltransferase
MGERLVAVLGRELWSFPDTTWGCGQGSYSPRGKMQPALPGSVLLATRLGIPILPVGITGSDKLRTLKWAFLHHPTITVRIGKPFNLTKTDGKLTKEKRNKLLTTIMEHIADLVPAEYRGVYTREKNAQD